MATQGDFPCTAKPAGGRLSEVLDLAKVRAGCHKKWMWRTFFSIDALLVVAECVPASVLGCGTCNIAVPSLLSSFSRPPFVPHRLVPCPFQTFVQSTCDRSPLSFILKVTESIQQCCFNQSFLSYPSFLVLSQRPALLPPLLLVLQVRLLSTLARRKADCVPGTASSVTAAAAQATTAITISGNAFFRGSDRFYIRGVDYQPGGSSSTTDPLSVSENCDRDVPYFQQLGINTIRVYQVDNSANHDYCMQLLQKAGIYLVLDVNTAQNSLNRIDAATSYNAVYLQVSLTAHASMHALLDNRTLLTILSTSLPLLMLSRTTQTLWHSLQAMKSLTTTLMFLSLHGSRPLSVT